MSMSYLMAGQMSELERLRLQSRVWEPAGHALLQQIDGGFRRVLDVGCGAMGWLRVLAGRIEPNGTVVGTDIDETMLEAAGAFVREQHLAQVTLQKDDLFASQMAPASFDLTHARFQIAPLGRADEQLAVYLRLTKPGGLVVLEDPDSGSWHFNPPAAATEKLIDLILEAFKRAGGNVDAGRDLPRLLRSRGLTPELRAEVYALPPGHPYLRLPLQFAKSLEPRLLKLVSADELSSLRTAAEEELGDSTRWGTTFTLIQAWARLPA
jgi:ubiquinone/menaquinone biosynthesis C-methylase UbiE